MARLFLVIAMVSIFIYKNGHDIPCEKTLSECIQEAGKGS